ncbi:hypothetical protein CWC16_18470 [Pseudoalteromonas sp. S3776]|uniref:glycosyltransferase family 2 protein n=1 Tax=Pseudoalteromonas sp. S3776 TaxID=579544 RepID=UPI001108900A|nr:glycosyltransferase family 2 protein [Pseudoalteromonas sp. S3776]TMO76246.1 hypothetical protein CWC16_18470 [Pseudoalteromonas sp. S3776]
MPNSNITISICTYKRAYLIETINSVIKSINKTNEFVTINIIDNDEYQSAYQLLNDVQKGENYIVQYFSEKSKGVVNARNKALQSVNTKWLIFVDDDEVVEENWLSKYLEIINNKKLSFGAVIGPVFTTYPSFVHTDIKNSGIHDRKHYKHLERICHGATGNCLIDMDVVKKFKVLFSKEFNETGGEDSDFFERLSQTAPIIWNSKSIVYEMLTTERASHEWALHRLYNNGKTYGRRKIMRNGSKYIPYLLSSSCFKLLYHSMLYIVSFHNSARLFRMKCEIYRDYGRIESCFDGLK